MMIRKIIVAFALTLLMSVGASAQKNDSQTLAIGAQGPETGPIATSGRQILAGIKLAVKEINEAGGVNGKQLKLINYDSKGDKLEAVNSSKKLISDKVCVIAGDLSSGAMFAIRDIVDRSNTPIMSSGATAEGVTDKRPFVFRNILLDRHGVPALLKTAMEKKGWKDFVVITSMNNDSSVALTNVFKQELKKLGGNVVFEQTVFDGDTDMSAQVTSLRDKKFDAIIFTGYYGEASLIMLELRRQNMPHNIIGGDGIMFPTLWKVAGDAAVGTMFFSGYAPDYPEKKVEDFNKKIVTMGVEPDAFTAQGYDAIYLFAEAMKRAGVTNCGDPKQRDKIRQELMLIKDFDGVSGKMVFDENGNAVKTPFIQEVVKGTGKDSYRTQLVK